jgi:hypothetical protein
MHWYFRVTWSTTSKESPKSSTCFTFIDSKISKLKRRASYSAWLLVQKYSNQLAISKYAPLGDIKTIPIPYPSLQADASKYSFHAFSKMRPSSKSCSMSTRCSTIKSATIWPLIDFNVSETKTYSTKQSTHLPGLPLKNHGPQVNFGKPEGSECKISKIWTAGWFHKSWGTSLQNFWIIRIMNYFPMVNPVHRVHVSVDRPGVLGPPWTDTGVDRGHGGVLTGADSPLSSLSPLNPLQTER